MPVGDSTTFAAAMDRARDLLNPPPRRDPVWPALAAAAALAATSVAFAAVMVLSAPAGRAQAAQVPPR